MIRIPVSLLLATLCTISVAAPPSRTEILPPELPWSGPSEKLTLAADHPWATPAETTSLRQTPRYAETVAWLQRLVAAAPELQMRTLGRSAEGREIWMVVASREGAADPQALRRNGRPTLLVHAGIHSGEIDGKDAGMMLLRDMTVVGNKKQLLDRTNLLFIPILSVDAHERFSEYGRINQRGPEQMGWRTNRRNLNLNRDYVKLETEELQALVPAILRWKPDLYLDVHVTDGVDYQYDVTYGYNGSHAWSPAISGWLDGVYTRETSSDLKRMGHLPGPLIFPANRRDMTGGVFVWTATPRFSNGWGDARHLPTVLVENHSLKPYRQRVLGTYVLLESSMRVLGANFESLRKATERDRRSVSVNVDLGWRVDPKAQHPVRPFRGVRSEIHMSVVSGVPQVRWTGELEDLELQFLQSNVPTASVRRPANYYIPAAWYPIVDRLRSQGIEVRELKSETRLETEIYRLPDAELDAAGSPFEGRPRYTSGEPVTERAKVSLPPGSFRVDTRQPLGTLAVLMLEPQSPDSLFQWGYFGEIMQRTEYFESYVIEPMAQAMLDADPTLYGEFKRKLLSDSEFAANPGARLEWFYRRTPFYDGEYRRYPVLRSID